LSGEEPERRVEDKLNELCFITNTTRGLCTMALSHETVAEVEELNTALVNQDKLLRLATRERKESKS
jgi:hypothetical protein